MEILEQISGAVRVLKPRGPLAEGDAEGFKTRALSVHAASLGRFVVDAAAIPFIDSRGLEVLVELTEELGQSGHALKLCGCNETIREVLQLTDLSSMFEHYADVNTAVRSFL
jgi:anti-sigma B factor antagonist